MTTYEDLLIEADGENLITREKPLRAHKGRIKGNRIAINNKMTEKEKKCVMAEELGHYYTGNGDILNQNSDLNRKKENYGRIYAYNKLIGLTGIIDAYNRHCKSFSETADYLEVTEEFLSEALQQYKRKYGTKIKVGEYEISFVPMLKVTMK